MKVLLINGSPNSKGCTYTALSEVADTLRAEGIETDFYWIGNKPISGCIACRKCKETCKCSLTDQVNDFVDIAGSYDGFIFGSPVYFSGSNGSLLSFMDRVFYSAAEKDPHPFRFKPAAAVQHVAKVPHHLVRKTQAEVKVFQPCVGINAQGVVPCIGKA